MNPYKFDLHFTVKNTAPEQYIVAPPHGVLHAEKSIDLYDSSRSLTSNCPRAVTFMDQSQQTNLVDRFRVDIRSVDGTQNGVGYFKAKHGSNGSRTASPVASPSVTPSLSGSLNLGLDLELIPSPLPPPPSRRTHLL